ncbi:MAG: flagellar basal body L-ring protein FlgH, partial [Bryobacteraceae bacterium]
MRLQLLPAMVLIPALALPQDFRTGASPGSLWSASALLADPARDLRARQVGDIVTILVSERASASATGNTKTARKSSTKSGVTSILGPTRLAGPLANLAGAAGHTQLQGEGTTSRDSSFTATLSARVMHVLPNGFMTVEGTKELVVNSETQLVTVRGLVRPYDLTPGNLIRSDRLANLEVRINGKGAVNDSVRRPFFLYRLLLGLLPF